jgi:predicted ester cyclase
VTEPIVRWTTSIEEGSGLMGECHDGRERSPTRNVAVVTQAVEEIWNQGNLDVADALFTASYVNAGVLVPDLVRGPEAIKIAAADHRSAFPRLHITIERMVSDGALVAFQWVAQNQAGGNSDATYRRQTRVALRGMTLCCLSSGKIVESWTNWDRRGALRKLDRGAGLETGLAYPPIRLNQRSSSATQPRSITKGEPARVAK